MKDRLLQYELLFSDLRRLVQRKNIEFLERVDLVDVRGVTVKSWWVEGKETTKYGDRRYFLSDGDDKEGVEVVKGGIPLEVLRMEISPKTMFCYGMRYLFEGKLYHLSISSGYHEKRVSNLGYELYVEQCLEEEKKIREIKEVNRVEKIREEDMWYEMLCMDWKKFCKEKDEEFQRRVRLEDCEGNLVRSWLVMPLEELENRTVAYFNSNVVLGELVSKESSLQVRTSELEVMMCGKLLEITYIFADYTKTVITYRYLYNNRLYHVKVTNTYEGSCVKIEEIESVTSDRVVKKVK